MNSEELINSIYNPKPKRSEPFAFPKITKPNPPQNKGFARATNCKYHHQNIFKIEHQKRQKVKMYIQQQRLHQTRNRQCEQLQRKMAQMTRAHNHELKQIEQAQKQLTARIQLAKKQQYQYKLGLWELKNLVITLNSTSLQEQNEYRRLCHELGYVDGEPEPQQGEDEPHSQGQAQESAQQEQVRSGRRQQGEQGSQVQPRHASRALSLPIRQTHMCNEMQLQEQLHNLM